MHIKLINSEKSTALLCFLNSQNPSLINNRILKLNVSLFIDNKNNTLDGTVEKFLKEILTGEGYDQIEISETPQFHAELTEKAHFSQLLTQFIDPLEQQAIKQEYQFYQLGICAHNSTCAKDKYGNIELKFIPKDTITTPGKNPDGMMVVNIHLSSKEGASSLSQKKLKDEAVGFLSTSCAWFKDSLKSYDKNTFEKLAKKNGLITPMNKAAAKDHPLKVSKNKSKQQVALSAPAQPRQAPTTQASNTSLTYANILKISNKSSELNSGKDKTPSFIN